MIGFSIDNGGVPYAGALNYPLRGAKVGQGKAMQPFINETLNSVFICRRRFMKAALGHLALSMLPKYSQGKRLQIYCFSKRNITGKKNLQPEL